MTTRSLYDYAVPLRDGELRQELHDLYCAATHARGGTMRYTRDYCREIHEVEQWVSNIHRRPWLLMSGGVGTGKTTMLCAIVRLHTLHGSCMCDGVRRGVDVMDAGDITTLYTQDYPAFDRMRRSPMLAIDDLGVENVEVRSYGNITTPVTELLSHRYERRLLTIISTNLPPRIIGERYGERVADRMRECAQVVLFPGPSHRGRERDTGKP